ncbi:hypothetical protein HDU81_008086 [Chytriomyces hyalinus]|nr:hypothetical protein HDU81_008086 [Chytriomyces hyalinus]
MLLLLALLSELLCYAHAIGCTVTDSDSNLYIFGAPYGDVSLGSSQSDWISSSVPQAQSQIPVSLANRPSFDTSNPTCMFAPFLNLIVVLNADKSSGVKALHVFDTSAKLWSLVPLTAEPEFPSGDDLVATVDHDTNVIYAYSNGKIFRIGDADKDNLSQLSANGKLSLYWLSQFAVTPQPFDGAGYTKPVFGQGTNHLHFFNAPGLAAGEAWIFVVHYAWWQPTAQSYGSFPQLPGQSVYIPFGTKAPPRFAYIPDDGHQVLLVDTSVNTTNAVSGFGESGSNFRYAATGQSLIQFSSISGKLKVLDLNTGNVVEGSGVASLPNIGAASDLKPKIEASASEPVKQPADSNAGAVSQSSPTVYIAQAQNALFTSTLPPPNASAVQVVSPAKNMKDNAGAPLLATPLLLVFCAMLMS